MRAKLLEEFYEKTPFEGLSFIKALSYPSNPIIKGLAGRCSRTRIVSESFFRRVIVTTAQA